jgi:hypothetical protein
MNYNVLLLRNDVGLVVVVCSHRSAVGDEKGKKTNGRNSKVLTCAYLLTPLTDTH